MNEFLLKQKAGEAMDLCIEDFTESDELRDKFIDNALFMFRAGVHCAEVHQWRKASDELPIAANTVLVCGVLDTKSKERSGEVRFAWFQDSVFLHRTRWRED